MARRRPQGTERLIVTEVGTTEHPWVTRIDGTWIGAAARPDVPRDLLEQALRNARPMTDDEYDDWLDAIPPK